MQFDEKWQAFSDLVAYEGRLCVSAEPFDATPDAIARHNERNLHVLRALLSLDERKPEGNPDEESPLSQELQRMESKINVLLDMVDRMLMPASLLPPRQPVRFNAVGAVLPGSVLPPGDSLLLRLHFDVCRALPLEIPARRGRFVDAGTVFVCFCDVSEVVQDGLERFVFCHHRRKVAEARLIASGENVLSSKHNV